MRRFLLPLWPWLTVYVLALVGIALVIVYYRGIMLSDPDGQRREWQEWRAKAALQDGHTGPVEREMPRTDEPPMMILMRDNFGTIFVASIAFPAMILGFALIVARGVFLQSIRSNPPPVK